MPASLVGSSFNPFRTPGTKPPYECATMKRFASSFEAIRINGINTTPTDVTLYDLSELVTVDQVLHAIEPYGVVYSIGRNVWGTGTSFVGILSGHWTVCMVMKRPVPSQLRVGREITHVSYPGQWIRRRPNAWKRLHLLAGRTYRALRGSMPLA
uniref:Uncharacterized protein n=1 Tax=Anopheles coluzzii TaxID=1518534 RepID=A0A8W7P238_ANOCL